MTTLSIQIDPPQDTRQRVLVSGRLDTHTYQELDDALSPLFATPINTLVLDLTGLEYISSAGIETGRLVPKGYGKSQLLNKCDDHPCSEMEHALNRRIEFKILEE